MSPVRAQRLLVLAGPPCAGKSYVLDAGIGDAPADLRRRLPPLLPPDAAPGVTAISARKLRLGGPRSFGDLVVHYDTLRPRFESLTQIGPPFAEDAALEPLAGAGEATILTLWAPAETLRARAVARFAPWAAAMVGPDGEVVADHPAVAARLAEARREVGREKRRHQIRWMVARGQLLRALYDDPDRVAAHYDSWCAYADAAVGARHLLVDASGPQLRPLDRLPRGAEVR